MKSSLITYSRWDAVHYSNVNVPAQLGNQLGDKA